MLDDEAERQRKLGRDPKLLKEEEMRRIK